MLALRARQIADKHSTHAHKATADISPLGCQAPPSLHTHSPTLPPLTHRLPTTTSLELCRVRGRASGVGRGHSGYCCGLTDKKKNQHNNKTIELVAFSLRVQMHTYPSAVALRLVFPVPGTSNTLLMIDPPPFPDIPPPPILCAQVWTFFFSRH